MRPLARPLWAAAVALAAATTRGAAAPAYQVGAYYLGMWSPQAYNPVDLNFGDRGFYVDQGLDWWLGVRTIHDGNLSAINASDLNWLAHGETYLQWFSSTPELKRMPLIGYYDVSKDATLGPQLLQFLLLLAGLY